MYGIRLSRELGEMKWREFAGLLAGLDQNTPLGRIVAIRAEDDPQKLKSFTPQMRRIRTRWRTKKAAEMRPQDVEDFLASIKRAFISMAEERR